MFYLASVPKVEQGVISMHPTYVLTNIVGNEFYIVDSSNGDILLTMPLETTLKLANEITNTLFHRVSLEEGIALDQLKLQQLQGELDVAKGINSVLENLLLLEAEHNNEEMKNG